jgi:5-methylcytosine-specific restriction endonuclease McrA
MSDWFRRNKDLYPSNWKQISLAIRERDGQKCKWCNVPNGAIGYRDELGGFHPWPDGMLGEVLSEEDGYKVIKIVLTVAHLGVDKADGSPGDKKDKSDCRDENLAALCQRCHLRYDADEHAYNRKLGMGRRLKKIKAGQLEMAL